MEMQYFLTQMRIIMQLKNFDEWKSSRWNFYLEYGIEKNSLNWYKHEKIGPLYK